MMKTSILKAGGLLYASTRFATRSGAGEPTGRLRFKLGQIKGPRSEVGCLAARPPTEDRIRQGHAVCVGVVPIPAI
jgi:hypothetical protein